MIYGFLRKLCHVLANARAGKLHWGIFSSGAVLIHSILFQGYLLRPKTHQHSTHRTLLLIHGRSFQPHLFVFLEETSSMPASEKHPLMWNSNRYWGVCMSVMFLCQIIFLQFYSQIFILIGKKQNIHNKKKVLNLPNNWSEELSCCGDNQKISILCDSSLEQKSKCLIIIYSILKYDTFCFHISESSGPVWSATC